MLNADEDEAAVPYMKGVSLVIPAFNEADRIVPTLEGYIGVLEELGLPFEVIVISDGHDATPAVAGRFAARGVTVYTYSRKLGRGGAIFEGFRKTKFEIVGFADADGSVPPSDFRRMLAEAMNGSVAVIASRRLDSNLVLIPEPFSRRGVGWVWHALVKALLSLPVK